MNESMCRVQRGSFVYYTCRRIPVRHAFTTKFGGVSTGACESLNLGFNRGDELENVRENYRLLGEALGVDETRMTLTKQIHDTQISVVTEGEVGMGLHQPDGVGVGRDRDRPARTRRIVRLLRGLRGDAVLRSGDRRPQACAHSGWRGMAAGILPKTVEVMAEQLGTKRESLIAVLGPSIRQECFETDADVPEAMEEPARRAACIRSSWRKVVEIPCGPAGHWRQSCCSDAGLSAENVIDSGICTMCHVG